MVKLLDHAGDAVTLRLHDSEHAALLIQFPLAQAYDAVKPAHQLVPRMFMAAGPISRIWRRRW